MEKNIQKKVQVVIIGGENLNKLLLLQMKKDRGELWQNVTGSVDEGENFLEAASRELLEETGLSGQLTELEIQFEFNDRWNRNVLEKVFLAKVSGEPEVMISEEEHQDYKWLPLTQVTDKSFGHKSNYISFLESLKNVE
ncbi:NUDIX domain-containing protein [Halobacteriovorax sp.]|uniref:NUDIX domain-containing protein n=1 Tax=Halobacteriovorax sp. TaxID=2020862 RepID=UPI003563E329